MEKSESGTFLPQNKSQPHFQILHIKTLWSANFHQNRSVHSRDIKDQRIERSDSPRAFSGQNSRTRFFPDMRFSQNVRGPLVLSFYTICRQN